MQQLVLSHRDNKQPSRVARILGPLQFFDISEIPPERGASGPALMLRGGGSDSYWNIQKTTSVLGSAAKALRRTSQARGSGGSLIQKQFETIQSSCVFEADEICFDGCVSQWRLRL